MQKSVCVCRVGGGGGGGGGARSGKGRLVRMVVNEVLKLFWKCKNKRSRGEGVRVDLNKELNGGPA